VCTVTTFETAVAEIDKCPPPPIPPRETFSNFRPNHPAFTTRRRVAGFSLFPFPSFVAFKQRPLYVVHDCRGFFCFCFSMGTLLTCPPREVRFIRRSKVKSSCSSVCPDARTPNTVQYRSQICSLRIIRTPCSYTRTQRRSRAVLRKLHVQLVNGRGSIIKPPHFSWKR